MISAILTITCQDVIACFFYCLLCLLAMRECWWLQFGESKCEMTATLSRCNSEWYCSVALMLTAKIKQKQIIRQNGNCSRNALHKQNTQPTKYLIIYIYAYPDPGVGVIKWLIHCFCCHSSPGFTLCFEREKLIWFWIWKYNWLSVVHPWHWAV